MSAHLLSLDDPRARDRTVAGSKAAWLSRARAAGLPVLPGRVVAAEAAVDALRAGQSALDEGGAGRARRAAMDVAVDADLARELGSLGALGDRLVVRSSSELDDDGAWAGAFASYGDVRPDEVERAVRGCWASVFAPGALGRFERTGRTPASLRLGVLVQPHLTMAHGGWARIDGDAVEVAFVAGSSGPLLSGEVRGQRARVALREDPKAGPHAVLLGALRRVAARARDDLGADRLEWGAVDDGVTILQLGASGTPSVLSTAAAEDDRFRGAAALALARPLATRRGPLADRLLTPWAGSSTPLTAVRAPAIDRSSLHARAAALLERAGRLEARVEATSGSPAAEMRDALASGRAHTLPGSTDGPLREAAAALLAEAEALEAALAACGALDSPAAFWRSDETWLLAATRALDVGESPPSLPAARPVVDRWDELRFGVARAVGERRPGVPASPGRATGRAHRVSAPEDAARLEPGDVLVVEHPVPALAPFLWERGGVVAASGSPGSHLCEVARSIHVPMVVGVDLPELAGEVVALDGDTGETWTWRP